MWCVGGRLRCLVTYHRTNAPLQTLLIGTHVILLWQTTELTPIPHLMVFAGHTTIGGKRGRRSLRSCLSGRRGCAGGVSATGLGIVLLVIFSASGIGSGARSGLFGRGEIGTLGCLWWISILIVGDVDGWIFFKLPGKSVFVLVVAV